MVVRYAWSHDSGQTGFKTMCRHCRGSLILPTTYRGLLAGSSPPASLCHRFATIYHFVVWVINLSAKIMKSSHVVPVVLLVVR